MYSSYKWSSFSIIRCLVEYYKYPCLWDFDHPDYKNKYKREKALEAMAQILGINSTEFLKKKIHSIRNSYINELKKINERSRTTGDRSSNLPWFNVADGFLSRVVNKRPVRTMIIKEELPDYQNETYDDVQREAMSLCDNKSEQTDPGLSASTSRESRKRIFISPHIQVLEKFRKCDKSNQQHIPSLNETFDIFGQSVAAQLKELPLKEALKTQLTIQTLLTERLIKFYDKNEQVDESSVNEEFEEDYHCSTTSSSPRNMPLSSTSLSQDDYKIEIKSEGHC